MATPDPYQYLNDSERAMSPAQRLALYNLNPYDPVSNRFGLGEGGQAYLWMAVLADWVAISGQLGALGAQLLVGSLAPRTVHYLTASTFYEAGNVVGDYAASRALILAQTASGTGYVSSAVYDSVNARTVVTVGDLAVDSGLTQSVLGLDPAYAPKSNVSPDEIMFWAGGNA